MLTALLILCLSSAPVVAPNVAPKAPASPTLEQFFRQPDRVQIFLSDVDQNWDQLPPEPDTRKFSGPYLLTREGPALSKEDREALGKIWVSPKDFEPRPRRKCMFNPDITLRFWRGTDWLDVVACFSCEKLAFYDSKRTYLQEAGFLDDFALLQRLATQAFPEGGFFKR
ncbi:hypothetical protein [Hyalangium minutum]|uniref:Lipoprotein n=1 Tax=Hyalangium minutum TaxID=394096 RepID=A0A085W5R2_9BACT|nr:hypothetical protein [Hyalangium minutum]KFE63025.1 hypothetical protein DB31_3084 [Hyalangium minutum]